MGWGLVALSLGLAWVARQNRVQAGQIQRLESKVGRVDQYASDLNDRLVELKHEVRGTRPLTDGAGRKWGPKVHRPGPNQNNYH
jgi:hypothetical protein